MLSKDFLKPVEEEFGVCISKTINFKQKTMGTFIKWGLNWRKKFQWGEAFNKPGHCSYATDAMVHQDQNDSIPLELHLQLNCRCQDNGSTRFDVGAICLVENELGPSGFYEPKLLNNFKIELEAKLPPGKLMWPAFWLYYSGGEEHTVGYKYLVFDVFEGWSGPNGNYKSQILKDNGCLYSKDEDQSFLVQTIYGVKKNVLQQKKRTMYKNFRNEYEVDNLTTQYHKFSIQRTDSVITMECDDEVLISIGKSNKRFKYLKDPVYLMINNGACCAKIDSDTANSILYIRNLSIQEL